MKVKDFIESTSRSKDLCKSCMEKEVEIQATINSRYYGQLLHTKITRIGYKFSPLDHDGCLVLDLDISL